MELVSCHCSGANHLNLFLVGSFLHPWAWSVKWGWETVHGYESAVSVTVCSGCRRLRGVVTHEVATKCSVGWKSQIWFVVNCFVVWQELLPSRQEAKDVALKFWNLYTSKDEILGRVVGSCIVTKTSFCTSISVNEIFDQEFNFSTGASTAGSSGRTV